MESTDVKKDVPSDTIDKQKVSESDNIVVANVKFNPNVRLEYAIFAVICGFIREINEKFFNHLSDELIYNFLMPDVKNKYSEVTISKTENCKSLENKSSKVDEDIRQFIESNPKSLFYFNIHKCANCSESDSLIFVNSYANTKIDIHFANISDDYYYYQCNEYKCNKCEYYIGNIIRVKYTNCIWRPGKHSHESYKLRSPLPHSFEQLREEPLFWGEKCKECSVGLAQQWYESYYDSVTSRYCKTQREQICNTCGMYFFRHAAR